MLNLITNRTAQDVERWRELQGKGWAAMTQAERTEWQNGMRGAYNQSDINRVTSAVNELVARFEERGTVVTLASLTGMPSKTAMQNYLGNVDAVRKATGVQIPAPPTPTVNTRFDYERANDLEKILLAVEKWLDSAEVPVYSGERYSGEV